MDETLGGNIQERGGVFHGINNTGQHLPASRLLLSVEYILWYTNARQHFYLDSTTMLSETAT